MKVEGNPKVIISQGMGKVIVRTGVPGEVLVQGELQHATCAVDQQGDDIRITGKFDGEWYDWLYRWIEYLSSGFPKCNLELRVPENTVLDCHCSTGTVEVIGLQNDVRVSNSTGTIRLTDIKGKIQVKTSTGSVVLNRVKGNIIASASTGEVRLEEVEGIVSAHTSTGSIHMNGVLLSGEEHRFTASTGSIHISLKRPDVTFEASVGTGSIHCYPESAVTYREAHLLKGYFGNGSGTLFARTSTGSVHIQG